MVFSREDRRRYRDKVRRCLDVFAQMLRESRFEFEEPKAGLEIELNLVDERGEAAMKNIEVLEAIAQPDWATELGQFNVEINVLPESLDGDGAARLERVIRDRLNHAEERARTVGGHMMMVGILPHAARERRTRGHAVGQPPLQAPQRADLRGEGRGPAPLDRGRGVPGGLRRQHHAEAACTSLQLHLQVSPRRSPPTGTPPRPSRAPRWRWRPTRRSCSAAGSGRRPGSRCSSRPPTPARWS
ncbi:hypothetical protein [Streptosporangium vulgare]|uniref:hypothetical protein n=1 Tax=Streptosporangium vulgare TaxID=46190 RepID=UPI0031D16C7E